MEQKTKRSKISAEELSTAVNLVKSENSGIFGVKDVRSALKGLGVPMSSEFATTLVQQGYLIQARRYNQKKKAIQQGTWEPKETVEVEEVLEEVTVK